MSSTSFSVGGDFAIGRVIGESLALVGRNAGKLGVLTLLFGYLPAAAFGMLRVTGVVEPPAPDDILGALGGVPGENIAIGLIGLFLQGAVAAVCLGDLQGRPVSLQQAMARAADRYIALFVVGLITNIGVFAGALLLLVPGIYLALRWTFGPVLAIARNRSGTEALKISAQLANGHYWKLLAVAAIGVAIFLVLIVVSAVSYAFFPEESVEILVYENLLVGPLTTALLLVMGPIAASVIYTELTGPSTAVADVFN